MRKLLLALAMTVYSGTAFAQDVPKTPLVDPYDANFSYHQINMLGDPENIQFDSRVIVRAPSSAEDSLHVPVLVDATAVPNVKRIVMLADYGPIPQILTYWPKEAEAKLSFRFKIDQATPVRAAVQTHDGSWHIGSTLIDAAGGGCTVPASAYATADWTEQIGKVNGQIWPETGRMRLVLDHPMDTGLADGIPVFIVQKLDVKSPTGQQMAQLELHEPVNEDPAFTLYFPDGKLKDSVDISSRDNNGNTFDATLRPRLTQ